MTDYDYGGTYSWAHYGYLDGIHDRDPNPRLTGVDEYDTGYLHGLEDKDNPEKLKVLEPSKLKKGVTVRVPKGTQIHSMKDGHREVKRATTVVLHDVSPPTPSYYDSYRGEFSPPKPPEVLWAGSGGYWCRASAQDVEEV